MTENKLVKIDWWDHPEITKVWNFVETEFDKDCARRFDNATTKDAYSIQDYRHNALNWIEDQEVRLEELEKKVKALPLDKRETMTVEEAELQ